LPALLTALLAALLLLAGLLALPALLTALLAALLLLALLLVLVTHMGHSLFETSN
jgi:hypothetical protein